MKPVEGPGREQDAQEGVLPGKWGQESVRGHGQPQRQAKRGLRGVGSKEAPGDLCDWDGVDRQLSRILLMKGRGEKSCWGQGEVSFLPSSFLLPT